MSTNPVAKLFIGKFSGKLDDKNRLTIPREWRALFEDDLSYMATFYYPFGTIMVFPAAVIQKIAEVSAQVLLSNPEGYAALSTLGGDSSAISCDKAGRITLCDDLLNLAKITKDVRFTGSFRTFQIASTTPPPPDTTSSAAQQFLRSLKEIGL